jgi:hypothetical protein
MPLPITVAVFTDNSLNRIELRQQAMVRQGPGTGSGGLGGRRGATAA